MLTQTVYTTPSIWSPTLDNTVAPIGLVELNDQYPTDSGFLFNLQDKPIISLLLLQNLNFVDFALDSQKHYKEEDLTFR
jgi:hypothetical protein